MDSMEAAIESGDIYQYITANFEQLRFRRHPKYTTIAKRQEIPDIMMQNLVMEYSRRSSGPPRPIFEYPKSDNKPQDKNSEE